MQNANTKDRRKRRRVTYWSSRKRVVDGLRRAARELYDDDPQRLPSSTTKYAEDLGVAAPVASGHTRADYPPQNAILEFFQSMNHAWLAVGFIVETKVYRLMAQTLDKHPELHGRIELCYQYREEKKAKRPDGIPTVRELAAEYGIGHHLICNYAAKQGWVPAKEPPWSRAELKLLEKYAHMSPTIIQKHMSAAGFHRTEIAIRLMRKRRNAHKGSPYYSGTTMMRFFGVDPHKLDREWLAKFPDDLPFELKGTTKGIANSKQGGDTRLFHVDTIRSFVIKHPEEIDLGKVDKMWFLWLITNGQVKLVATDRVSKRNEGYQPHLVKEHRNFKRPGRKLKPKELHSHDQGNTAEPQGAG